MPKYLVTVTIENKPGISDPEGDTILNDLILKGTYSTVSQVRCAKTLKFTITEKNKNKAKDTIEKLCHDLRIYNPIVSKITIDVS